MSKLKIYGISASRTFRTLWMALELGIDYEQVPVGFADGGVKSASFLAVNPNGRVPAIKDGDFALWESMAINLYLAKKYGKALYPADLEGEARCWQWSFWAVTEIDQPIITWASNSFVLAEEKRDPAKAAEALATLDRPLGVLEGALAGTPYLLGDRFTVADLDVAAVLFRALRMDLAARPRIAAWLKRCYDRPAAQGAVKLRG